MIVADGKQFLFPTHRLGSTFISMKLHNTRSPWQSKGNNLQFCFVSSVKSLLADSTHVSGLNHDRISYVLLVTFHANTLGYLWSAQWMGRCRLPGKPWKKLRGNVFSVITICLINIFHILYFQVIYLQTLNISRCVQFHIHSFSILGRFTVSHLYKNNLAYIILVSFWNM